MVYSANSKSECSEPMALVAPGVGAELALRLRERLRSRPLGETVISLLCGHFGGSSSLPSCFALSQEQFREFVGQFFRPAPRLSWFRQAFREPREGLIFERAAQAACVRAELLQEREKEFLALEGLLLAYRAGHDDQEVHWARIVAAASLSERHLWKALGLGSRGELRQLLSYCFPRLVAKNVSDMRWKRFFYRELCEQGGDFVCRAPSCGECSSYSLCFVPIHEGEGSSLSSEPLAAGAPRSSLEQVL